MVETLQSTSPKYVIVTPVRDEEQYIRKTLESVTKQTIQPTEWIIVDDGSKDATGKIIDEYAGKYPWIKAMHRSDRGKRLPGTGVMEAFHFGYGALKTSDWDYIVKLDGDVGLNPEYFAQCFQRFRDDPKLGMCGGRMYRITNGNLEVESHPIFHVRGPIKLYSKACWEAIGGLIKTTGWDTVDEVQANRLGWRTKTFPELKVIHYRPTGAAEGYWKDNVKTGKAAYISGYHPVFMIVKCAKRLFQKPYVFGAIAHGYGYILGYWDRIPRVGDEALIRYVRSQQMRRLMMMKSIWK